MDSAAAIIPLTVALEDCNDLSNCSRRKDIRTATLIQAEYSGALLKTDSDWRPRAFAAASSVTSDAYDSRLTSTTAYFSSIDDTANSTAVKACNQ